MKAVCALLLSLIAVAVASFDYGSYPYPHYPLHNIHPDVFHRGYGHTNVAYGYNYYYFFGVYDGTCRNGYDYGFYKSGYIGEDGGDSFIVCDHGIPYRFSCPAGTVNSGDFKYDVKYGMNDICNAHV